MFDFRRASAVVVSGDGPNKWGHMLLNTGGVDGNYFQIAGIRVRPRYMNEEGYQRYLKETGKSELKRIPVFIANPEASQLKLEQLLNESWAWGVVVHNCESMVEEIIMAGGGPKLHSGPFSLPTNAGYTLWSCGALKCPSHARRKDVCRRGAGVWLCGRKVPPCPGHAGHDDSCGGPSGKAWTCWALECPTHAQKGDRCSKGMWKCKRLVPPCPAHSRPEHYCSEKG